MDSVCVAAHIQSVMPITISHPLGRVPTFPELQALARQHGVQLNGDAQSGDFQHPDGVSGNYSVAPDGGLRGQFAARILGKLAGTFLFVAGKAEVTITEKPFLLPEAVLKSKVAEGLAGFCAQFPTAP